MDRLFLIDRVLIETVLEPFAQYVERAVGINCFGLAQLCVMAWALGTFYVLAIFASVPGFVGCGVGAVAGLLIAFKIQKMEATYMRGRGSSGVGYMNPEKHMDATVRRIALAVGVFMTACSSIVFGIVDLVAVPSIAPYILLHGCAVLAAFPAVFFVACDTLPPGTTSKLRELLTNFGRQPELAPTRAHRD